MNLQGAGIKDQGERPGEAPTASDLPKLPQVLDLLLSGGD